MRRTPARAEVTTPSVAHPASVERVPCQGSTTAAAGRLPLVAPLSPVRRQFPVELVSECVDALSGLRLRRVSVADESDHSPTRAETHGMFALLDEMLRAHPEWVTPRVTDGQLRIVDNPTSEWVYTSATMREWRYELVPSAIALYPVQRQVSHLPSGAPVDTMARRVFLDSLDGIGIRSRARIMSHVVQETTRARPPDDEAPVEWVSLACGAAVPVLDALAALGGVPVRLALVDLDAGALDFAARLAAGQGLVEDVDFTLLQRNLVRSVVAGTSLVDELGADSATVVEALGIFEYFSDLSCTRLLRNTYRLVRPGGVLVIGNMLSDRPQLAFNQRAVGWPHLYPRSVEQLIGLVRAAGLPLEHTTVTIPEDGVYAVVHVTR
jgi:SAM-dependent methyltransferase